MAVGSLVASLLGAFLGIPLALLCYLGVIIPVIGVVLGVVALTQIKRTGEQGRGLAVAGILVGVLACIAVIVVFALIGSAVTFTTA